MDFVKAQIKRKFKENPELVIATLQDKMPDLLPAPALTMARAL